MKIILLLFIISSLSNICFCWWDTGHMLVAKVAELTLKSRSSKNLKIDASALELAENITSVLNQFSHGKITNFVESATWPDDIKQFKMSIMDNWHYLDVPIRMNDPTDPQNHIVHSTSDSAALLKTAMNVLMHWSNWEIKDPKHETLEKSMMLRYLVHVMGDIHQPLHSAQLFDDELFPKGDIGGNLFLINYTKNIENLHKFFDSGADSLPNDINRPLNETSKEILENLALEFMGEFPDTTNFPNNTTSSFDEWIGESATYSKNFVYKYVSYKGNISEEYKFKAFELCRKRITQGGYRLARLIEEIYGAFSKKKEEEYSEKFLDN